jgi:lysyl-tRNA synthetase class 2
MSEERLTDQEQQRRLKLARLREAGIEPYPARAKRTHTTAQAIAALEAASEADEPVVVTVVGRLVGIRVMGKSSFVHIEDGSGRLQLYLRRDLLGEEVYAMFRQNLDLGDFVEASGPVFITRTREPTVRAETLRLLSKALRPLPVV